jgi:hypothetical protein
VFDYFTENGARTGLERLPAASVATSVTVYFPQLRGQRQVAGAAFVALPLNEPAAIERRNSTKRP